MAKKKQTYTFQPERKLTVEELTTLIQMITTNMIMTQEIYETLDSNVQELFKPREDK